MQGDRLQALVPLPHSAAPSRCNVWCLPCTTYVFILSFALCRGTTSFLHQADVINRGFGGYFTDWFKDYMLESVSGPAGDMQRRVG